MCEGRHYLIMRGGLNWAPTYIQTQVFLRLLQSSFQVNMPLILPSSLQSVLYSCPTIIELVDFMRLWRQLERQR